MVAGFSELLPFSSLLMGSLFQVVFLLKALECPMQLCLSGSFPQERLLQLSPFWDRESS